MSFFKYLIDQGETPDIVDEANAPAVTYIGYCDPGTNSTADAKFRIKKITVANSITTTLWAEGNRNNNKSWDNRANYNYTFLK